MKRLQVTVYDEDGKVVHTGWVLAADYANRKVQFNAAVSEAATWGGDLPARAEDLAQAYADLEEEVEDEDDS